MKPLKNLPSLESLIDELGKLPGIGPKSATALAYHLVSQPPERLRRLAEAISTVPKKVKDCSVCGTLTEEDPCGYCTDASRDASQICIVESTLDLLSIERSGAYSGRYHVLGGVLSPLDGIGPAQLRVRELLERLKSGEVQEIILATNPSVEGEATANYLKQVIGDLGLGISLSRFARGLPVGGDLAYTDEETLAVAIQSRKQVEN
jgi:recombination protein RecR